MSDTSSTQTAGIKNSYPSEKALIAVSDVLAFTRLAGSATPDELGRFLSFLANHHSRWLEGSSGEIIKFIGDACLMVFPADDADKGINILKEMRESFVVETRRQFDHSWLGMTVQAHVGLIYRVAMPPEMRSDIFGIDVNTAFRLGAEGGNYARPKGGEIILSPQAFRSLEPASRKAFRKYTPPMYYRG